MKQANVSNEGLETEQVMGEGEGAPAAIVKCMMTTAMLKNAKIAKIVNQAIVNKWQLVLVIDNYSIRQPQTDTATDGKFMCTIIIKVFKNIQALPACPVTSYHSPYAINITFCINIVSGPNTMHKLTFIYSSIMPFWITDTFFNPELERHRITFHQY